MDPRQLAAGQVGIRMYKVGFGDCFLLFLQTAAGLRKVLVDCGSMKRHAKPLEDIVSLIIEHVRDDGTPRIDLVIATHRHRDHIQGFAEPAWRDVEVGEVWMPWTEDPRDDAARTVRLAQATLARALVGALRGAARVRPGAEEKLLDENESGDGLGSPGLRLAAWMALNAQGNQAAADTLHGGFKGNPPRHFLPSRDRTDPMHRSFDCARLPGARFHLLGPPQDEEKLGSLMPPKGERYLRALAAAAAKGSSDQGRTAPFAPTFKLPANRVPAHLRLDDRVKAALRRHGEVDAGLLALLNDHAINNTSLIFVLEFGRLRLLFSGDAQWGPWEIALADPEWRELLNRVDFYKVGHHASHNATPRSLVENHFTAREGRLFAMVSVAEHGSFKDIPRPPLMEALRGSAGAGGVVRSDDAGVAAPFEDAGDWIDLVLGDAPARRSRRRRPRR